MVSFNIQVRFPDHFGLSVHIHVSSSMSTIGDLKKHISDLFDINDDFYLTLYGDVLHPKVNIKVLYQWAVVTARKGSFLTGLENLSKKTWFDRLKRSCINFKENVVNNFFEVFEVNSPNEEDEDILRWHQAAEANRRTQMRLFHKCNDRRSKKEILKEIQIVTAEIELKAPIAKALLNQNNGGVSNKLNEEVLIKEDHIDLKAAIIGEALLNQTDESTGNKDEDSDDDFVIVECT